MAFKKRESEQKRIHAYIATPAYNGNVHTDFAISLAESVQFATLNGIQTTAAVMGNGAFIELARNTFLQLFLQTDCTHLFFIDADLRWDPRGYAGLLASGHPICAGIYPKRQDPEEYPCHWMNNPDGTIMIDNGWIMCDRVPTGFLCIERRIVEEMVADAQVIKCKTHIGDTQPYVFETYVNEDKDFVGEDFAFCAKYVAKYGKGIHVFPDLTFTHDKRWTGNLHNWLNKLAETAEKVDSPTPTVQELTRQETSVAA